MASVQKCLTLLGQLKETAQKPYDADAPVGMQLIDIVEKLAAELDEGDRKEKEREKKNPFPKIDRKRRSHRRFSNGTLKLIEDSDIVVIEEDSDASVRKGGKKPRNMLRAGAQNTSGGSG